jgi:AP-1 complex subunit mu
VKAKT